jgi:hypothetical protein
MMSVCTLFCIRDVLQAGRSGVWISLGKRDFLFSTMSIPVALVPTLLSIQWVLEFLLGVKWLGRQVSYSSPSIAKLYFTKCLHGVDRDNFTCCILNLWLYLPSSDRYSNRWDRSIVDVGEADGAPKSVLGRLHVVQLLTELQETYDETDCARGCQWIQR